MSNQQAENWDREADLTAEIARLNALLRQAAVNALASSDNTISVAARHARELNDERGRTVTARADANELHHRVKNTLATVQAIANATLRPDVAYDHARTAFNSRLEALTRVQDLLFERNWADAKLSSLVKGVVAPHVRSGSKRIRVRGLDIDIGPKFAIALALGLNELATNAMKYGALSNDAGYVEIAWTEGTEVRLRWHERQGPSVEPPSRKGFGSRLITDSITTQFNGKVELEFKPDGLICTICVPAKELRS